jgi:hypothetical protein
MKPVPRTVDVGRTTLTIPDGVDTTTARNAAATVAAKVQQIEEDAAYIDTQRFALQAALEFAILLERAREEATAETKETLLALNTLQDRLGDILKALSASSEEAPQR